MLELVTVWMALAANASTPSAIVNHAVVALVGQFVSVIVNIAKKAIKKVIKVVKDFYNDGFLKEFFKNASYEYMVESIKTIKGFRSQVKSIKDQMDSVKLVVDEVRKRIILTDPSSEQLRPIDDMLSKCQDLIHQSKKLKKPHILAKLQLSKELEDLKKQILSFCVDELVSIYNAPKKKKLYITQN